MKVLVTGGLGFIGSHTTVVLQHQGYEVVVVDDLSNSSLKVLDGIEAISGIRPQFQQLDLRDKTSVETFFKKHPDLNQVIHFAASKAVGESVEQPLAYYENNIGSLVYLLQELVKRERASLIFSSSCTVYGQADQMPITEEAPTKPANSPYGNTKQIGEEIIRDSLQAYPHLHAIALRYFNPIGAHPSALIGELPIGTPQNLVPFITQTAIGQRKQLSVFGDDYPTRDGTAIRDYIHIMDLAEAHVTALQKIEQGQSERTLETYNLGTGKGSTVLEVIQAFEQVSQQPLPYVITERRPGDIVEAYADPSKSNRELGWTAKRTLEEALESAWKWQQKLNQE
ncbi:UDP-glucose 4-epimerase GalE [Croceiramulus getboli]|nr:UDP-glucose 4-epimerase GalE [Flavobacteriaceae bacterium YJPT1-3]